MPFELDEANIDPIYLMRGVEFELPRVGSSHACQHVAFGEVAAIEIEFKELPSDAAYALYRCPTCGHRWKVAIEG